LWRPGAVRVTPAHERLLLPGDEPLPASRPWWTAAPDDPRDTRLRRIDPAGGHRMFTVTGLSVTATGYRRGTRSPVTGGPAWSPPTVRGEIFSAETSSPWTCAAGLRAPHGRPDEAGGAPG